MTTGSQPPPRDRRFAAWIGSIAALLVAAAAFGFVWLPAVQAGRDGPGLWDAICSAIGLPSRDARAVAVAGAEPASNVAWTAATQQLLAGAHPGRGAALAAASCNGCHGPAGVSDDAIFPNLAGQSRASIYKQLQDFKSGRRDPAVMGGYVAALSDGDLSDLAAHYAALPAAGQAQAQQAPVDAATLRLVDFGDPMRGIAACAACHGPMGTTTAAPRLDGQQRAYLEVQLEALASGARHNDISGQMRGIARQLTAQEIGALAAYYAAAPAGEADARSKSTRTK
ncbi:MAG TPA: c-type cytochrome [Variovorax sp.]|nr:c-type cytochrome [Variovorax sp.]